MERKLFKYLEKNNYKAVANLLYKATIKETLKIINILSDMDLIKVSAKLKKDYLASILVYLSAEKREIVLNSLNDKELEKIFNDLSAKQTMEIIEGTSQEIASKVLKVEEVGYLLNRQNDTILKPLVSNMSSKNLSALFEELKVANQIKLFKLLPKELALKTFTELSFSTRQKLLARLSDDEIKDLMAGLVVDTSVTLVKEMPFNIVKKIMTNSSEETKNYIQTIIDYPEDSVGRIMSRQYLSVSADISVKKTLMLLKDSEIKSDAFYNIYVVDSNEKLLGMVSVRRLFKAQPDEIVADVMDKNIIFSHVTESKKSVAGKIFDYNLITIPVVNEKSQLVGIVSIDEAAYIQKQRAAETMTKMNALTPITTPYLKTSIWQIWKNRIPWLLVLLISATFTGLILNSYEAQLNAISPVLFACVPMMMDTGGNCGSQSSVTIIRSLSLNEITLRDWWKVVWKEFRASIWLGITLGLACFAKLLLIDNLIFGYSGYTLVRSAVVSLALIVTVMLAKIVGCLLPIIAKKIKLDPAVMAAPFITTIVDSLSLIIFCTMSVAVLA